MGTSLVQTANNWHASGGQHSIQNNLREGTEIKIADTNLRMRSNFGRFCYSDSLSTPLFEAQTLGTKCQCCEHETEILILEHQLGHLSGEE